jgi:mono/diheme cytochrome c family protein
MTAYEMKTSNRPFSAPAYCWFAIAVFAATAFSTRAATAGDETFKAKCVGCHGADGSGDTAMGKKFKLRDLRSADVQKQSDADLQSVIEKGKPPMPAYAKTLDTAKVQELVAYIRSIAAK